MRRAAAVATAGAGGVAAVTAYYHRPSADLSDGMWLKTRVQVRPNATRGRGAGIGQPNRTTTTMTATTAMTDAAQPLPARGGRRVPTALVANPRCSASHG